MLLICLPKTNAQYFEFKGYLGATYYQGDLAPLPVALSFAEGNLSWSLSAGYHFNDLISIHTRYTLGKLLGDDANASSDSRRVRNLSFQSPLTEYALLTEVNLNYWIKSLDKYGINIYYSTGVALFTFDPQAVYNGELYHLQALGTEGQGLPGYPEKYSKTTYSIPFGLGFSFKLSSRFKLGIEMMPRKTFTDYIDDVSGNYVSTQEFLDAGKNLTATLANRTGEYLGGNHIDYATGAPRGDATDDDWYFSAGISLSYLISNGKDLDKKVVDPMAPPGVEENSEEESPKE